jgi:hypothetical protein
MTLRFATLAALALLAACSNITPTKTVDLCQGDTLNRNCAACTGKLLDPHCEQCKGSSPAAGCKNADGGSTATGGSGNGSGGKGGGSGSSGTGGSGTGGTGGGAGNGGTAGSGMDAGKDAGPCGGACSGNKPVCVSGACEECGDDGDCKDPGKTRCDPTTHACVQCLGKSDCSGTTPQCETSVAGMHTCVECLQSTDCKDTTKPVCADNACVACSDNSDCKDPTQPECKDHACGACTGDDACKDRNATPHCDTASSSASKGQCVQCLANADCTDLASPQCVTRACQPCTSDAACTDRMGTRVCDTADNAPVKGKCVECTGQKYAACLQGSTQYVCDSANRVCSGTAVALTADVCFPCVSDAQCEAGKICMKQTFDDPTDSPDQGAIDIGYFCAWRFDAASGPNMNCFSTPPYVARDQAHASIDGTAADVCVLAVSTCPALTDFRSKNCALTGTPDDNQCGFAGAPHDGYCVETSSPGVYRCTMPCGSADDCKPSFSCNGSNKCTL